VNKRFKSREKECGLQNELYRKGNEIATIVSLCFQVVFSSTRCAKACVEKLNNTSKMGKIMTVFVDTMGRYQ
jgi:hypothetical protein